MEEFRGQICKVLSQPGEKMFRVLVLLNRSIIAHREKISGILRFVSHRDDWDVKFVDTHVPSFADAVRNVLSKWHPHAVLTGFNGDNALPNMAKGGRGAGHRMLRVLFDVSPQTRAADAFVCVDNEAIAREGATILARRGFMNLAYLGKSAASELPHSRKRRAAFRKCAEESGCRFFDLPDVNDTGLYWMDDLPRLARILSGLPKPCGVMAYCDQCATLLFDACRMARLAVPDQIAVVGVDNDSSICERTVPTLTSICPMFEDAGYIAAELADAMLRHTRTSRRPVTMHYGIGKSVERMSTLDINGKRRIALMAAEHIRMHHTDNLTVRSLAETLNVSVRLLELRFKEVFGRTVRDELLQTRLDAVCRLLIRTDMSIGDISASCGFRSSQNLMLLFKKRFGCPMSAYRRKWDA